MIQKLHKRCLQKLSDSTERENPVVHGHERHEKTQPQADDELRYGVSFPPAG